ncbi:Enoyl-CoA hydratase/carnithine racemase [Burkholderiales bacterium 8X]|nr:Enoyl-CoA hydratase/carnithine racemase [Burkholderiales bacterium 8X]
MREVSLAPGVVALDFDRPSKGNSLTTELVEALLSAIDTLTADEAVHTLVLRPEGLHFCTGFDLSRLEDESEGDLLRRFVRVEQLLAALWYAPIRTIACAQGRAWGAGADLFAMCDVRAARPSTTFCFPGAQFGLVLGSRRLAERVGTERAREWIANGSMLDASAAQTAGLVTDLLPTDEDEWLAEICTLPRIDRATMIAIRAATRSDGWLDADLSALVRSATRAGLKERILAYRARAKFGRAIAE